MNLLKKQNQNLFKFLILIFFILSNSAYSEIQFISAHTNQARIIDGDSLQIRKEKIISNNRNISYILSSRYLSFSL